MRGKLPDYRKESKLRRLWVLLATFAAAMSLIAATAPVASAHGCTFTLGYYKNNLDKLLAANPNFAIPFPANIGTTTQQQNYNNAIAILSYSGSDPVAKLEKQFMAAALTLGNNIGDMQGPAYQDYLAAQSFLQSYLAAPFVLSAAQKQQVLGWASELDNFNNGLLGTPHCSDT